MEKNLDYPQFPDNTPAKVKSLVDNLQSIRLRLQSLDATYGRVVNESPELMQALAPLNEKWRQRVQSLFEKWARLEKADTLIEEWSIQASLPQELEQQHDFDDRALQNLYAVVGSTQSLLEAMKELGDSLKQINWNQWAVARF